MKSYPFIKYQLVFLRALICLIFYCYPFCTKGQDMSLWITETLQKEKGNYTLKDIVIPGSHDAGMSVLYETAGSQKSTINECNTLTQTQSIEKQIKDGVRMFDLRTGLLRDTVFLKHSSSDCIDLAVGGGYGERLDPVLLAAKQFLITHPKEFLILGFSHFCPKEMTLENLATDIIKTIGKEQVYVLGSRKIQDITIKELAGKALIVFEATDFNHEGITNNAMVNALSANVLNFRRAYAATNNLNKMIAVQAAFFRSLAAGSAPNDLIRLDWQITQSAEEAAMVCNAFQSDKNSPVFDGSLLVANLLMGAKSILAHAKKANSVLPARLDKWIADGTINVKSKPNILYVDAAGNWITKYCIQLNNSTLYQK